MRRLICFVSLFLAPTAWCQTISGLTGTMQDSTQVTISGSSFGTSGPTVFFFENFESGENNTALSDTAQVGTWYFTHNTYIPEYMADPTHSGNIAGELVEGFSQRCKLRFDPTTEFYLSYKVMVPDGYTWPEAYAEETFYSLGSSWKFSWLYDAGDGDSFANNDDYCIPTYGSTDGFSISGNDHSHDQATEFGRVSTGDIWWSWDEWNRISCYMKAGEDPDTDTGIIWAQAMNSSYGQKDTLRTDVPVFDGYDCDNGDGCGQDDETFQWTMLNFPGWTKYEDSMSGPYDTDARGYYDDIYLALGDNARARVEVGDSLSYDACTKLDIFTPTAWSATSITATARITQFGTGDTAYLFVVDADGNVSDGYEVTVSGESAEFSLSSATVTDGVLSLSWTDDSASEWYVQAMINDTRSYSILATANSVSFPVTTGTVDVKITSSDGPLVQGNTSSE